MKTYLKVPFMDRDKARRLGAKWDAAKISWFVEDLENLTPFLKWMPAHLRKSYEPPVKQQEPKSPTGSRQKQIIKQTPKEGALMIWTDGSCNPNPGPGGWGWHSSDGKEDRGGEVNTTNNRMEITAIIRALQELPDGIDAAIFSDSQYCIKGVVEWGPRWKQNQWLKKGEPIPNRDLWIELDQHVSRMNATFHWVRGHNGDINNEQADLLAEQGRLACLMVAAFDSDGSYKIDGI